MLGRELIEKIKQAGGLELEITILDGFNGGGVPRTINFGPRVFDPSDLNKTFEGDERQDYGDIETAPGGKIVVMGYGFY